MKSIEKYSKKDSSLSQYYSQLQKYESGLSTQNKSSLKKEYSLGSFSKEPSKTSSFSKTHKDSFRAERPKLGIVDKHASKTSFERFDRSKLENIKKYTPNVDNYRTNTYNTYIGESLANSNVTSNQWNNDSILEKENIPFSVSEQEKFANHCSHLYNIRDIRGGECLTSKIEREINKRDEVYQVVGQHFPNEPQENYSQKLKGFFNEYELMGKIIDEFKQLSKLEKVSDLNELHYILKSDN